MRISILIAASIAALAVQAAEPDALGVQLSMKISKNDGQIAAPRILTRFGQTASIRSDKNFQLVVVATESADKADLQFDLKVPDSGELKSIGKPRMLVEFDQQSALEFSAPDGARYRISVIPSKQVLPTAPDAKG